MNTGSRIAAGLNVIQAVAIVIAAVWAYSKFVRGRTSRSSEGLDENTGGASSKDSRVATFAVGDLDSLGRAKWSEIAHASVFRNHEWIESKLGG
jgi:hypothetical protein